MVLLGHRIVSSVVESLCPRPSRAMLQRDIIRKINRQCDIVTGKNIDKERYLKMSEALCLCTKMSKKNTIERKIYRAILYNGVTCRRHLEELMKKHQFSFSNGEAKKRAKLDYNLLIKGEK